MDNDRSLQGLQDTLKGLAAEVTIQRRALEKIMEQLADYDQPIDYSSQIAGLEKEMASFTERVGTLMQLPALANNSERLLNRIEMTTKQSSEEALRGLAKQVNELESLKHVLLARLQSERHWREQTSALKLRLYGGIAIGATVVALIWMGWSQLMGPTNIDIAWAMSAEGREAHELADLNTISRFLECTGQGWQEGRSSTGHKICIGGDQYGWFMRQ